ncbi:MAG TPA: hypothetical protein VD994_16435, partial [Prosthecobacter sp.]|nr:hypothetical protein [Prosthecobacter sp.]
MTAPLAALEGLTNTIGASPAAAVAIVIGLLLVFFGRNLFWIFVAGMGFLAGLQLAPTLVPNQPGWIILLIGIGLGLVGALLSIFLQRLAVALAGGYAGGLLALRLATELGWT